MLKHFRSALFSIAAIFLVSFSCSSIAAETSFGEYKYVIQISDMAPGKQTLVLNNASNLLQAYPPGEVTVEVVAYGPGLRLLYADNPNAERVDSLSQSGVRFSACNNTIQSFTRMLGYTPKLNPDAKVVPGGVVRIGDLVRKGYVYIRP